MINFLFAGLWLVINHTDNRAHDYPLIKKKYGLLLFMTPLIFAEMIVQAGYFFGLKPDIITSCCGTLFTSGESGLTLEGIAFPAISTGIVFYATMALTFLLGIYFLLSGKAGYFFSLSSMITFFTSIIAFLSFICLYFYEIPTHHCPFCVLQKEYGFIGYPIYFTFLAGGLSGLGVGIIMPFKKIESLREGLPFIQRKLAILSLLSYFIFLAIVTHRILFSNLTLIGY
jgi:hypothetical protein